MHIYQHLAMQFLLQKELMLLTNLLTTLTILKRKQSSINTKFCRITLSQWTSTHSTNSPEAGVEIPEVLAALQVAKHVGTLEEHVGGAQVVLHETLSATIATNSATLQISVTKNNVTK